MPAETYTRANLGRFTKNKGGDFNVGHNFKVDYGTRSIEGVFKVEGVGDQSESVAYSEGERPVGNAMVRPGLTKTTPVTIERYFSGEPTLANLWKEVQDAKTGQVERQTLAIQMLDDTTKQPSWEIILHEAWLKRYVAPTFDARSSSLATESGEFVYEHLEIKKA